MDFMLKELKQDAFNRLLGTTIILLLLSYFVRVAYCGLVIRLKFRRLLSRGIPVLQPYSLLLGHLPLFKALKSELPKDAHDSYVSAMLAARWKIHFPDEPRCPPLIYVDLWPFFPQPIIYVTAPEAAYQLTQANPQPRHHMFRWALAPVTGGQDLISMACSSLSTHKFWRSLLIPGFSSRNLIANLPTLIEEVVIFANILKANAGDDGEWGRPFTMYHKTLRLTFDVIARVALGLHPDEQTSGPGPLFHALGNLIPFAKMDSLWNRLERLLPTYRKAVSLNGRIFREALLPRIEQRMDSGASREETIVDSAYKGFSMQANNGKTSQLRSEFIDTMISQIRFFLFAGQGTTAHIICWTLYEINRNPGVLQTLLAEHDKVFGIDPAEAETVLRNWPHKIKELHYTNAVVKETLRLHAPSKTFRKGNQGFFFSIDGKAFPTDGFRNFDLVKFNNIILNTVIQTNPVILHLRKDLWPRPLKFLPERFMAQNGDPLFPAKNAWRPFEAGSMRCIGEELAMTEIALCLVFTQREVDFDFD